MSAVQVALFVAAMAIATSGFWAAAAELPRAQLDFFENKIRPLLVENCYKCHSPSQGKVKAGLELDWQGGWKKGGASGPALVARDPGKSLLIKAVRYTDPDLQMPPNGAKLSDIQVADLVHWVEMGAPDPRTVRPSDAGAPSGGESGRNHWAFQPVRRPDVPAVKEMSWVHNEVDRFILAKLEANRLEPSPPAEKTTLIRRVYYDLIGLPPTPEAVRAYLADESPGAFEKVVDQLLQSPQYGERWGRHWLDVARYSDAKGQFDKRRESSIYPYAWTYRDYVIGAFNDDKPYDRFLFEQLAADRLALGTNRTALAALGFLTLGDHFNGNVHDIINDRIDVTTKAALGLTVSCARCHDHKFDPIPQADYYSLHGIFASSVEPLISPEISDPALHPKYGEYQAERKELDTRVLNIRTQGMATVFGDYKRLAGVYLFASQLPTNAQGAYLGRMGAATNVLKNWQQIAKTGGRRASSIFGLWNRLLRIPEARFAQQVPRVLGELEREARAPSIHPHVLQAFKARLPRSLAEAAVIYGNLFADTDPAWQSTLAVLLSDGMVRLLPNRQRAQFLSLREQSDLLEMTHPGAPARAPALADSLTPKDSPIFKRGEAENKGEIVPRRFLEVLSGPNRSAFRNGSGRLELAQAITSRSNPLTARVMVNRVWLHHFGEGLVATPDDFGTQSSPPSHPELLDYLAGRFMEEGWSVKKLHKLLLLSATYQQGSQDNAAAAERDPGNRWLWRAPVRRLEFEPLRDSLLSYGGQLDLTVGGHPVDLAQGTRSSRRKGRGAGPVLNRASEFRLSAGSRRTIYGYVDRSELLEEFNTFDVPNPAAPVGKRYESTVPQQALYLMNSPLVVEQIRKVVQRTEFQAQRTPEERVRYLYMLFFQRTPKPEELQSGLEFVRESSGQQLSELDLPVSTEGGSKPRRPSRNTAKPPSLGPWQEYAQALLLTNEASFVK